MQWLEMTILLPFTKMFDKRQAGKKLCFLQIRSCGGKKMACSARQCDQSYWGTLESYGRPPTESFVPGSAEEATQFIESMVKSSSQRRVMRELPKTTEDCVLKVVKDAEFIEKAYELACRCRCVPARGGTQEQQRLRCRTHKKSNREPVFKRCAC